MDSPYLPKKVKKENKVPYNSVQNLEKHGKVNNPYALGKAGINNG